jgi:hypothetical protein
MLYCAISVRFLLFLNSAYVFRTTNIYYNASIRTLKKQLNSLIFQCIPRRIRIRLVSAKKLLDGKHLNIHSLFGKHRLNSRINKKGWKLHNTLIYSAIRPCMEKGSFVFFGILWNNWVQTKNWCILIPPSLWIMLQFTGLDGCKATVDNINCVYYMMRHILRS